MRDGNLRRRVLRRRAWAGPEPRSIPTQLSLVAVGLLAVMAAPGAGSTERGVAELRCVERAQQATVLDEVETDRLCLGATSLAPLQCYIRATDELLLDQSEAITLCRCATTTEPVQCFDRARSDRPSETQRALRLCSPISARNLTEDCRPIVPTDPRFPR